MLPKSLSSGGNDRRIERESDAALMTFVWGAHKYRWGPLDRALQSPLEPTCSCTPLSSK